MFKLYLTYLYIYIYVGEIRYYLQTGNVDTQS